MIRRSVTIDVLCKILAYALVFGIAAGGSSILIYLSGFSPLEVYGRLLYGGFGTPTRLAASLTKAVPVLLCSLGVLLAFKCGVWNIGGEGQLYMGGLFAFFAGFFLKAPQPLHLLLVAAAAFLGGGAWGGIAGFLKIRYKINEILSTLVMNFIAIYIVLYVTQFPFRSPSLYNIVSMPIAPTARLPLILPGTSLHAGFLMALGFSVIVWFILQRSILGYRIKAVGVNPETALYGGIPVKRIIMTSMIVGSGLAGLAGMGEVSGVHYQLPAHISNNYGYMAIAIVLVARLNSFVAIAMSLFYGGLLIGGRFVQANLGISNIIVDVLLGSILLLILVEPLVEKWLLTIANYEHEEEE